MLREADLAGEGEWEIETGGAVHVDGMQGCVGALHLQRRALRYQKNVRNVVAMLLVEVTPLLGKLQCFASGNVFQINDGVGNAALGADD